jgi:DNA polymerase III sliding clamp (beta) subunit (PCNA family)
MNQKIVVKTREIRAVLPFVSTDDSRFVLNGICFEARKGKPALLIATDGRRLAVIESEGEPCTEDFEVILKTDYLKPLCAFAKQFGTFGELIEFDYHPSKRIIATTYGDKCVIDSHDGSVVEGKYPAWRQVAPSGEKEPVNHIGVNAELLADFVKSAKALECDSPCLQIHMFTATAAMEVHISERPNFYAVIMPMKIQEEPKWQPEFLGLTTAHPTPERKTE